MKNRIDSDFLEKLIVKSMMVDKKILTLVCSVFEPEYFDDTSVKYIFEYYQKHLKDFNKIAPTEAIINSTKDKINIKELFNEVKSINYDIVKNQDSLLEEINYYLKDKAIKKAMVEGIDIIDSGGDANLLRDKIEKALCKDIKIDLGLDYFKDLGSRLKRIFTATDYRIPTYFPQFDEYINGGFPPFTLSVLVAKIHGWKSQLQANFAARQVLHGHNIALLTLEMSENEFARRFDAIYSNLDINRIYVLDKYKSKLVKSLKEIRDIKNRGNLYIKQFPTGAASVIDFKIYLRELIMRDIKLSAIYVDYINLMKAAYKQYGDLYSSVKTVSEELRALSFEFEVPVISVSQLNREGSFIGFENVDFNYIAESLGLAATADFMNILGLDEDSMVYQNEVWYKIVKNRLGGRVGETDKFYTDSRSLKIYDATELDLWMSEKEISGDERKIFQKVKRESTNNSRRR